MNVSHLLSNLTSINTYVVSDSSTVDYFCVADGLLHTSMDMEDGVGAAANDEPENEWASDGEATVFEEYHELQDDLPRDTRPTASEADSLRAFVAL